MAENGEEKLIAVARHIAKTLGNGDTNADDILKIFSNFDGRLREKLTDNLSDHSIEQTLNSLDRRISRHLSSEDDPDNNDFLDSIDHLVSSVRDWTPLADDNKNISSFLDRAEELLQQSMFRLEHDFRTRVENAQSQDFNYNDSTNTNNYSTDEEDDDDEEEDFIPVAHPITDYDIVIDALPASAIADLHEIGKRMVAAGYVKECSHAYSTCRRDFLEESLSRLGVQRLSTDEVQRMQWAQLEDEIDKWIKAINVSIRILFPSERRLCDRIFLGFSSAADLAFMEVCRAAAIQLFNFADAVAIGSRAPERIFKVLDVYETMRDLMPEFDNLFSDQYCVSLRNEAVAIWKRLGEVIRGIFMELENLIRRDPAKSAVPGGGLHPITRYVMNYIRAACRSRLTLEQVFEENVGGNLDYRTGEDRSLSSLAVQMAWIMELLESNLEAKSKIYRDPALCSVFMMNNGRYIVDKVKDNDLGALLGDDWIKKHTAKIRQYHVNYQRSSWSKVLGVLKIDSNSMSPNGGSKTMREKLKLFNTYFDEIIKVQSSWVVFDDQLREEMRISVSGTLSPAYRNFIAKMQSAAEFGNGKNADRYIKYSVEDVEAQIGELFQRPQSGRR